MRVRNMDKAQINTKKKALFISAHADDAETSAGGTIARLKREGWQIWSLFICDCPLEGHIEQHQEVCRSLGVDIVFGYFFHGETIENHKQEIRDKLFTLRNIFNPDVVFCPASSDMHQDHKIIAELCLQIFRDTSTILGYEVLRSIGADFKANFYVILIDDDVQKKLNALRLYKTQKQLHPWFNVRSFFAQMEVRGVEANTTWAEAFEMIRGRMK